MKCVDRSPKVTFCIKEGVEFNHTFAWRDTDDNPISLTGCEVYMQVRRDFNSDPLVDFKAEGFIVISDADAGEISIHIPADKTFRPPLYEGFFDILVVTPSQSYVILDKGEIIFERTYTRIDETGGG